MVIVTDGQQEYRLSGRAAAMVRYIARQADRLNVLPQMRLEFHCRGFKAVQPKFEICDDEEPID